MADRVLRNGVPVRMDMPRVGIIPAGARMSRAVITVAQPDNRQTAAVEVRIERRDRNRTALPRTARIALRITVRIVRIPPAPPETPPGTIAMPAVVIAVENMTAHAVARWKRGCVHNARTAVRRGMPRCVAASSARLRTAHGMPRCGNGSSVQTPTRRGMPRCVAANKGRGVRNIVKPMDTVSRGRRMRPAIAIPATNRQIAVSRRRQPVRGAVMRASNIANRSNPRNSHRVIRSIAMWEAAAVRFTLLALRRADWISQASSIGASSCLWALRVF